MFKENEFIKIYGEKKFFSVFSLMESKVEWNLHKKLLLYCFLVLFYSTVPFTFTGVTCFLLYFYYESSFINLGRWKKQKKNRTIYKWMKE